MLRSIKYGVIGAVVAGTVATTAAAWPTSDTTVKLVLDGNATSVSTTASTVSGALRSAGYRIGSHDLVAPSPGDKIHNGTTIVFNRGRELHLMIDGVRKAVWTTAPTVAQALSQLGFTTANFVSVSRSKRLPLSGADITVRTPKFVTVRHDWVTRRLTTTDGTVGSLLRDLGVTLGSLDRVWPPQSTALANGTTIKVTRITHTTITSTTPIPYRTKQVDDPSMDPGHTKVATPGQNGTLQTRYAVVYVDGKLTGKTKLDSTTLLKAVTKIEKVGTAEPRDSSGAVEPAAAQAIAKQLLAQRGWSDQFGCLLDMWNHESGWRTNAENPNGGAYGIPQSLPGSKMASAGPDWQTSARTQITWGLDYIASRYGDPCGAWSTWQAHGGWY